MLFSFVGVVLAIQKSPFFNVSKKKQLALGVPAENLRPPGGKEHTGTSDAAAPPPKTYEGLHLPGSSAAMPSKDPFLSAFDNPEVLERFRNDEGQSTPAQASKPAHMSLKEAAVRRPSSIASGVLSKRKLSLKKPLPLQKALQGKGVAVRASSPKTFTRTLIKKVQKTVTRSIMVPFYQQVTSTLHHPVTSIVVRSVLVPVIQHSTVTVHAMPFQKDMRMLPYPRVSQAPLPYSVAMVATDAQPPAVATVAQPSTTHIPEEHREQPVRTVTKYVDTEGHKGPDTLRPARTVTVFKRNGDQTVTLDLRESKMPELGAASRSQARSTQHEPSTMPFRAVPRIAGGNEEASNPRRSVNVASTDGVSGASEGTTGHSGLDYMEQSTIPGRLHMDDELGPSNHLPASSSKSAFVPLSPGEKSTVTITNISIITVTKSRELPSIAYRTVTINDTKQLNNRLEELENSFRSGAENYLSLIVRIIRLLENERGYRPSISLAEDVHKATKHLAQETKRSLALSSIASYSGNGSSCLADSRQTSGALDATDNTLSAPARISSVSSSSSMSRTSRAASKATVHKELRNPLLEILDLVSGNAGRSNLVDSSVSQHSMITPSGLSTSTAASSEDTMQRKWHSSRATYSIPGSMMPERSEVSPKDKLLEELMRFINKDSRSEEDILKILGLIRLVKSDGPEITARIRSSRGVPVAKTVTIIGEDSIESEIDAPAEEDGPKGSVQEASVSFGSHSRDKSVSHATHTATVYITTTLSEVHTETRSQTLTVDHTITRQETQAPRTVTVSYSVPHVEKIAVRQTVTQYRTVTHLGLHPGAAPPQVPFPMASTSPVGLQKKLYVLAPMSAESITSQTKVDGLESKTAGSRGFEVIELGKAQRSGQKGGSGRQKRKKRIRSAEITLENLSGSGPRIIDINLPVDQLRRLLEREDQTN